MIYTVTFNPSIDYVIYSENFETGKINKIESEYIFPGGKGINVSIVLKNLGVESVALGFTAGFTGAEIQRQLAKRKISTEFIQLRDGVSRINIKLKSQEETELNGYGPSIREAEVIKLMKKIKSLKKGDFIILGGSVPKTLPANIYEQILEAVNNLGIHSVVDATGNLLVNTLKYRPFLIKPNIHELEQTFHAKIGTVEEIIAYGKKLQDMGAQNIIISMGGDGAVFIDTDSNEYYVKAPAIHAINTVGSGDSMVAGFLYEYLKSGNKERAFYKSIAAGSASAAKSSLATKKEVENLFNLIYKNKQVRRK